MLSRVADSIFWMSRYIERAENAARFIDVNQALALGGPAQWAPLIHASGDHDLFKKLYGGEFTERNVLAFLLFDDRNPNAVVSCLVRARENARTVRDILSTSMWEAVNAFYLRVRDAQVNAAEFLEQPHEFLERVKRFSHQIIGVTEATMSHGEAWYFAELGRLLERADKTSRILDVKYFILLPKASDVGSSLDVVQWSALLDSTSALHMYRKRYGRISPAQVVEFLMLDPEFPRSMRFCVDHAEKALRVISGTPAGAYGNDAERLLGELSERLSRAQVSEIIAAGLHEFVDDFQTRLNAIGRALVTAFFGGPMTQQQSQQ
jgi:uncharacterized alpha-E superfamily protein